MPTVLVIEDDTVLLALIANTLQVDGYVVHTAADSVNACAILRDSGPAIDLVLTDVEVTPLSGLEVAKRIKQSGLPIPVLFMSGYSTVADVIRDSVGREAVLQKPFTAAALRQAVKKTMRFSAPLRSRIPVARRTTNL